jgi:NhaA family Na+:H+ antiporter
MPIFAFANAGVHLEFGQMGEILKEPVTLGIIFGLFIGKPLGIVLASVLVVKLGFASLPRGVTWIQLTGVGFLAGIGFTMSLFVNELAFVGVDPEIAEQLMSSGKIAIFIASILSAVVGIVWLKLSCREVQR